jgi:hypothetical protein
MTPPIGDRAVALIVAAEVTSEAHYRASLAHPTWPGGAGCADKLARLWTWAAPASKETTP